ncbi:hypothetical protein KKE03_00105, partial [Patescibacteria group bacterium]|nr:hypothetical protein [Patescibacteria group bacterium]
SSNKFPAYGGALYSTTRLRVGIYTDSKIATVGKQIKTADVIKGYRFVNLNLIKKFKLLQGREKDKKDLELIENYEKMAEDCGRSSNLFYQ